MRRCGILGLSLYMRDVFYTLRSKVSFFAERIKAFYGKHPTAFKVGVLLTVILLPVQLHAQTSAMDTAVNYFLYFIVQALQLILQFFQKIILFLVEILIGFSQYNSFGSASNIPVATGWVIVRDVCNMFFIVILLVSAFATIIGYDSSFHYKAVLPKLLLMAILINFSKTLVMLLIDFSQVIMLTFVNAFSQAAAGNFINAFQLQGYQNLSAINPSAGGGTTAGGSTVSLQNIILAYLLGIVMSVIVVGILIIFIAFIIARIVGLWIALIFSPAAFFATALPGRLSKSMSVITNKYWDRLGGMLTGGPIVAFFLWLTLATVQRASTGGGLAAGLGLMPQQTAGASGALQGFLTAVGNTQGLATFIIAIAMMMLGLDAAVSAADAVGSGALSTAAKYVKGKTLSAAKFAAMSPILATKHTLGAVDRRVDLTGKLATAGLATVGRIPIAGALMRKTLVKGATFRRQEAAKEASELQTLTKGMSVKEKQRVESTIYTTPVIATLGSRKSSATMLQELSSDANMKKVEKDLSTDYEKQLLNQGVSKEEAKGRSERMAKAESMRQRGDLLHRAEKLAVGDQQDEIKKLLKENPHLYAAKNDQDYADNAKKIVDDPEALNKISADAKSSMKFLIGGLLNEALVKDAAGKIIGIDGAKRDALMEKVKDKELEGKLYAAMGFIGNSPGGVTIKEIENAIVQKDKAGNMGIYQGELKAGGQKLENGNERTARVAIKTEIIDDANSGRALPGVLNAPAAASVNNFISSGGSVAEALRLGKDNVDEAVSKTLVSTIENGMNLSLLATNKTTLDASLNQQLRIVNQIDSPGIDSGTQIKMLAGMERAGVSQLIAQKWDLMDRSQRKTLEKAIEVAMARAQDVAGKRASGNALTADDRAVEEMVTRLREALPRRDERDPATNAVIRRAAPSSIGRIIHES